MIHGVPHDHPSRMPVSQGRPLEGVQPGPVAYMGAMPLETIRSLGRAAPTDQVSLSPEAQAAAAAQGVTAPKSLEGLPEIAMDVDAHMEQAESRLSQLMAQLGMPRDTEVTIRSDRAGRFTVESDHPKAAELEAAINADPDMRNALIGAENAAILSRLAAASAMAMRAADANPDMADRYYDWLRGVAKQTQATPVHFEMAGGSLSGGFTGAQGQILGITEGLTLRA